MIKFINSLWFVNGAEEAANWYVSLFPNSRITATQKTDALLAKESGQPEGGTMWVAFELDGQPFLALNGGEQPWAKPSGFISFIIECKDQAEIDHYWDAFADGGNPMPCGWITDKYGVTWQVVPEGIDAMVKDPKVAPVLFKMTKIIIADLKAAN